MENRRALTIPIATAVAVLLLSSPGVAQERAPTRVDLRRALELARGNNPALQAARHRIAEVEGDLIGASVLLVNNPELAIAAGPRFGATPDAETSLNLSVRLMQRVELGGQRGHRVDHATAQRRASEAAAEDVRRVLDLAVTFSFYDAIASENRVQIREEGQRLAERLFEVASRRLERGAGTPLEVNTARIRRAEAQRRLVAAQTTSRSARLRLRQLLALPANRPFAVEGALPDGPLSQTEDALVARALERRPDLRATSRRIEAGQAAVELADAEAWPDVSVGVSYGLEERDDIILGRIQIPIPLFNRNQGERQRARATVSRLHAEQDARRLAVESEVRRAYSDYAQARDALSLYDADVLRAQEESLSLLQRAFGAGEIGYADLIVVQRELLEGREGLVDVRLALAHARAALLASASIPVSHNSPGDTP